MRFSWFIKSSRYLERFVLSKWVSKKDVSNKMLSDLAAIIGLTNPANLLANEFQMVVDEVLRSGGR